jgi:hypothetical protein
MRPRDVEGLGAERMLLVAAVGDGNVPPGAEEGAEVALYMAGGDRVLLALPGREDHVEVKAASRDSRRTLRSIVETNLPSICWVAGLTKIDGSHALLLRIHEFPDEIPLSEPWVIGADDKILDQVQARSGAATPADLPGWLMERLVIAPEHPLDQGSRMLASAGADAQIGAGAFVLHGADVSAAIRRSDDRLIVDRLGPRRVPSGVPTVIVRGDIAFADATGATEAAVDLAVFGRPTSPYMELWQDYDALERKTQLHAARQAGSLRYTDWQPFAGQDDVRYRFRIEEPANLAGFLSAIGGNDLTVAPEEPDFLVADEGAVDAVTVVPREVLSGPVKDRSAEGTWLELAPRVATNQPTAAGVLYMSLRGDEQQRERRLRARDEIIEGRGGLPRLARIVQGDEAWQARRRAGRDPALSPRARAALGGSPTEKQELALEAALNTPDIALIQGPPGTGKTGVIAALAVRLTEIAEEREERGVVAETILLTSFQREAVANVGSRTNVMGFPARIAMSLDHRQVAERAAIHWAQGVADAVAAARDTGDSSSSKLVATRRAVRDLVEAYRLAPGARRHGIETVDEVLARATAYLDVEIVERLRDIRRTLVRSREPATAKREDIVHALRIARGLRVSAAAFEDDGPARARSALDTLASLDVLAKEDRERLAAFAAVAPGGRPSRLAGARNLRDRIVDELQRRLDEIDVAAADMELVTVLDTVTASLSRQVLHGGHGEAAVIAEYLDTLRNDPAAVEHVHRRYSRVVAATCQGSRAHTRSDDRGGDEQPSFDVVIVDEAARASPLDLMIPLSAARRQVILVGDHRQLPHVVDLELAGELATSDAAELVLRQSMFERLYTSLQRQSERDGVLRVVTLDKQFRMHPRLGSFVNETFYKPHAERVENGVLEHERAHDVPGFLGKVAAWVDVPFAIQPEQGRPRLHRPDEADAAVELLHKVAQTGDPDFTIAIVTFYARQVQALAQSCIERTLAVESSARGGYQFVGDLAGRAFLGTVDAFQGREFDVVILSPVRSNDLPVGKGAAAGRRRYGFLTIENRACVAMSRARRLLLVAGDRRFASDERAKRWIKPLYDLGLFCDEEEARAHGAAA